MQMVDQVIGDPAQRLDQGERTLMGILVL